jgi:hypothetical protein
VAFEQDSQNAGKLPDRELIDRFMLGMNTAIRAAAALAPYQDPKFTNIKVETSPLDVPEVPKTVSKGLKINLKDPIEVARIYSCLIRQVG